MKTYSHARRVLFLLLIACMGAQRIFGGPLQWSRAEIQNSTTNSPADLGSVAYGNGTYLAFGNGSDVFYADSQNPRLWARGGSISNAVVRAVAFGAGQFVAVGADLTEGKGAIFTSPDGNTWTRQTLQTTQTLVGVVYGNGRFVAIGENVLVKSTDALVWDVDTHFLRDPKVIFFWIAFGNGKFLIPYGEGNPVFPWPTRVASSSDAATWQDGEPIATGIFTVAGGRNRYLGLSESDCEPCGGLLVSTNLKNWEMQGYGRGTPLAIAYGNGVFAIAARDNGLSFVTSYNGRTWDTFNFEFTGFVDDMMFGNGRFVAVGPNLIVVSEPTEFTPLIDNVRIGNGSIHFTFDAGEGTRWDVEASGDLREWTVIGTIDGNAEGRQMFNTTIAGSNRFLRARKR